MKIDVTQVLCDLDGKPIPEATSRGEPTGKELTVRLVLMTALTTHVQSESRDPKTQVERFMLSLKVAQNDIVDLESEQVTNLKLWVANRYSPLVTGPICLMLEGKYEETMKGEGDGDSI